MAKVKSDLAWTEIDPSALSADQQAAYQAYKAQYKVMKDARAAFEDMMQVGVPPGKRVVCGYNFGKLSIALADAAPAPKTKPAPTQTLSAWLAAQAAR